MPYPIPSETVSLALVGRFTRSAPPPASVTKVCFHFIHASETSSSLQFAGYEHEFETRCCGNGNAASPVGGAGSRGSHVVRAAPPAAPVVGPPVPAAPVPGWAMVGARAQPAAAEVR